MKLHICGEQIMRWYLRAGAEQRSRTGAPFRGESPSHPGGGGGAPLDPSRFNVSIKQKIKTEGLEDRTEASVERGSSTLR